MHSLHTTFQGRFEYAGNRAHVCLCHFAPIRICKRRAAARIHQKNSCFMRQEVEIVKAFKFKLGLGII